MEENRKAVIISRIGLVLLMCLIALLALLANPWEKLQDLMIGSMLGLIVGAVLAWYWLHVWDPATMERREDKAGNIQLGCWSPFIVIAGIIGLRLLASHLDVDFVDMLVGTILSASTSFVFGLACMTWLYHPK